jgi:hypothetical protein
MYWDHWGGKYSVGQGGLWGMPSGNRWLFLWGMCGMGGWCLVYHLPGAQWRSEWRPNWAQNGGTFACIFLLVLSCLWKDMCKIGNISSLHVIEFTNVGVSGHFSLIMHLIFVIDVRPFIFFIFYWVIIDKLHFLKNCVHFTLSYWIYWYKVVCDIPFHYLYISPLIPSVRKHSGKSSGEKSQVHTAKFNGRPKLPGWAGKRWCSSESGPGVAFIEEEG